MSWEIILRGRVQGVGCRYYCAHVGKLTGLRGSATNCDDGTVSVIADTDDRNQAVLFAEALVRNSYDLRFFGSISGYELRSSRREPYGDCEW